MASKNAELAALGNNLDDSADAGIAPSNVMRKVKIMLEENENIPPGGQFFQVGGTDPAGNRFLHSYMLRPGEAAEVPEDLIEVLDNAVMLTPILDSQQSVVGYRDRLRYPYRIMSDGRR